MCYIAVRKVFPRSDDLSCQQWQCMLCHTESTLSEQRLISAFLQCVEP